MRIRSPHVNHKEPSLCSHRRHRCRRGHPDRVRRGGAHRKPAKKSGAFARTAASAGGGLILTGGGAGGRTASKNATAVSCDYTAPDSATTVNVLAYNSSAVDPFTNTM